MILTTITNLILITSIVVFIIDLSGIIDHIKKWIHHKYIKIGDYHNLSLKPLDCSLCLTFYSGLIYLLCSGAFTLPYIALTCLLAFLTGPIGDFIQLLRDMLITFINFLTKHLT